MKVRNQPTLRRMKNIIIGRIFESEIILIPPSLKISEIVPMGAIVIRTRYDEGTESAEVATSVYLVWYS